MEEITKEIRPTLQALKMEEGELWTKEHEQPLETRKGKGMNSFLELLSTP